MFLWELQVIHGWWKSQVIAFDMLFYIAGQSFKLCVIIPLQFRHLQNTGFWCLEKISVVIVVILLFGIDSMIKLDHYIIWIIVSYFSSGNLSI